MVFVLFLMTKLKPRPQLPTIKQTVDNLTILQQEELNKIRDRSSLKEADEEIVLFFGLRTKKTQPASGKILFIKINIIKLRTRIIDEKILFIQQIIPLDHLWVDPKILKHQIKLDSKRILSYARVEKYSRINDTIAYGIEPLVESELVDANLKLLIYLLLGVNEDKQRLYKKRESTNFVLNKAEKVTESILGETDSNSKFFRLCADYKLLLGVLCLKFELKREIEEYMAVKNRKPKVKKSKGFAI